MKQIVAGRKQHFVDQVGAGVNFFDFDACGQQFFDFDHFLPQPLGDFAAVFAQQHEAQAEHDFAFSVGRDGAGGNLVADFDVGHVADADRLALEVFDDDVGDFGLIGDQAHALNQLDLAAARQIAAADVGVIAAQGQRDVVERQVEFGQQGGVEQDVILFFVAAPTVHFGHAGNAAQMSPHQPVLDRAQLGQVVTVAFEQIVINFAHSAGDRPELGLVHAGLIGQFGHGEPLADQLAGAENIEAVLKNRVDLRQAKLRYRPHFGQPGQSANHLLDRIGDLDLDLFGPQRRHHRVDLHHHGTGVGKGVDRQTRQRHHA